MASIGKNIKRLRMEKGVTQEAFAKTINVSRQAVSSWETGRTQPDIEMLGSLSEALGVSIEELIYGERRNIKIDNEEKNYISTATLVISILGGILLFSGAVLILIWCWDHIPLIGKGVFSVMPLASGIAASVYVMMKKRDDSFFMEMAASAWMVGAILTVICINDFFDIHMGVANCIFVDAVLILFPMFIMRCVSPLIFYYGLILYAEGSWHSYWTDNTLFVVSTLFVLAGVLFVYINRKKMDLSRLLYAQWVTVIAVLILVWIGATELVWFEPFGVLFSLFALYYAIDKDGELISPFAFFGTIGGSAALIGCAYDVTEYLPLSFYAGESVIATVATFAIFVLALKFALKNSRDNILKVIQILCFGAASVAMSILSFKNYPGIDGEWDVLIKVSTPVTAVVMIAAFTVAILYIVQGLKENKLFPLNLGFVSIAVLTFMILAEYETDMLLKGCVLLVMGGILMLINLKITRVKEKERKSLTEVQESEKNTAQ